jgi:hypothetical protein
MNAEGLRIVQARPLWRRYSSAPPYSLAQVMGEVGTASAPETLTTWRTPASRAASTPFLEC